MDFNSTLNAAFNEIISSMTDTAQGHVNLADSLNTQVVDVLKAVERKQEELKKKVDSKCAPCACSI
jgi:adenine/guanine phosphoribosyltransferase-like PRPP-binding protein